MTLGRMPGWQEAARGAAYRDAMEDARRLEDDALAAEITNLTNDLKEAKRLAKPHQPAAIEMALGMRDLALEDRARARRLANVIKLRLSAFDAVAGERNRRAIPARCPTSRSARAPSWALRRSQRCSRAGMRRHAS